jgi:hypothetical protein
MTKRIIDMGKNIATEARPGEPSGDVLGRPGAAFYLERPGPGGDHAVQEMDGLQVLGGHEVLIIDRRLLAGLHVCKSVTPPAGL